MYGCIVKRDINTIIVESSANNTPRPFHSFYGHIHLCCLCQK
ncbi:hypothetical protein AC62_0758 [Escherichia coli 6-175-07_S3_C3]|nr:hypothetical protein AC62_0758 [Escherichia coli 6-175-07_S3_C3]